MNSTSIPIPEGIKGLIFDLDGTIIDSMPLHLDSYNHVVEPWGMTYPEDLFYSRAGVPIYDTMVMIRDENNLEDFDIESAIRQKDDFIQSNLDKIGVIDSVFEIIKLYHQKLPMAIGTGSNRSDVDKIMEHFSLDRYIESVVTANDVKNGKPHPETFLKCAELIGINPKECVVYEDGQNGIDAALAAGMQVVDITKHL